VSSSRPPSSSASPLSAAAFDSRNDVDDAAEVVLARYDSVLHAELVRGRLEAASIPVRLTDAHTAGLGGHLTNVIGGVKVIVARGDVEAARAILEADESADTDDLVAADDTSAPIVKNRADDAARWSLWLALLSALFPVAGQLGSVVLMWRAVDVGAELSRRARRQLIAAGAIDVATAALWWSAL
jgi:hypothetical protein